MSKTAFVILESDVIHQPFYPGKSGDFAIIDYLLRNNYDTFICDVNDLQVQDLPKLKTLHIKKKDYSQNYHDAILNECRNIINKKTPGFRMDSTMRVSFEYDSISSLDLHSNAKNAIKPLLISRAMPQSLTKNFLKNFSFLAKNTETIQNMPEICLYKDKAIPFLLQKDKQNIADFYKIYGKNPAKFKEDVAKNHYTSLAIDSMLIDINDDFNSNYRKISDFAKWPICIKPFNLFGGVGVGIFENIGMEAAKAHLELIRGKFQEFSVTERQLAVVQKTVARPEFGDIRVIFTRGKFRGAFKRYEPKHHIHNTINGAIIVPVCNANMQFFQTFEIKYRNAFTEAIRQITELNSRSAFLQNEFICGYDLLLDEQNNQPQFKLTETNIACPTGFAFLDASIICNNIAELSKQNIVKYFTENKRVIDSCLTDFLPQ